MNDMVFWTYTTLFVGHTAFLTAVFLAAAFSCFALTCLALARRSFVAAMILAIPALLMRRLGFGALAGADGSAAFFDAAHLFRCASDRKSTRLNSSHLGISYA